MRHRHHEVCAIYDISSSSVAGGHVLFASDEKSPVVFLAAARDSAPLQENIAIDRLVHETVTHLENVISQVRTADIHHPSLVEVVLASPWYRLQTHKILYKKDTPFMCTQKLVDALIDAEVKHILENTDGPFGKFGTESWIVEKQLSPITLNGYTTAVPHGKRAKELECTLTITIAPKPVIDLFSDALKRAYGTRTIRYTTSSFATFVVARDSMPHTDEASVIIDVGEEITDVAFVKQGILLYQHSFPVGTYGLYRALAAQGIHTIVESEAVLESYRLNKLAPNVISTVEKAIGSFTTLWQDAFRAILDKGEHGFCMPDEVMMVADTRFEKILTEVITRDPFIAYHCATGKASVTFIDDSTFKDRISYRDQLPIDASLSIGALFTKRLLY